MSSMVITNPAEQDYLAAYLRRAFSAPMLSRQREVELAVGVKEGGRAGQRARDELVTSHLKLAASMARKYGRSGVDLDDLVQEANIGLLQAVDKFDHTRGFRFSTCAFHWIRQQLNLAVTVSGGDVRLPINRVRDVRRLKDAIMAVEGQGKPVTDEALAAQMKCSVVEVRKIAEFMVHEVSLDKPVGDSDLRFGDSIADESSPNPEEQLLDEDQKKQLALAVEALPERDRDVLTMRFGLDGEDERTLAEVSERFGVSRERIRQIEVAAIKKLRKNKKIA